VSGGDEPGVVRQAIRTEGAAPMVLPAPTRKGRPQRSRNHRSATPGSSWRFAKRQARSGVPPRPTREPHDDERSATNDVGRRRCPVYEPGTVSGDGGNDAIELGAGDDRSGGGDNNAALLTSGHDGDDTISGGPGHDSFLLGDSGVNTCEGMFTGDAGDDVTAAAPATTSRSSATRTRSAESRVGRAVMTSCSAATAMTTFTATT
jgi:hypothetical protein